MNAAPTPGARHVDVWRVRCGPAGDEREAALRSVLARLLGTEAFELEREPNGRRRLAGGAWPDLRFSFAQRGALALVAVRLGHDVGVDFETARRGFETEALAQDHFDESERAAFAADPDPDRDAAFLRAWTRHEALAKACGAGLVAAWPADARERYRVRSFTLPDGFAAVASEGDDWEVRSAPALDDR